jgi:hypothetical protein
VPADGDHQEAVLDTRIVAQRLETVGPDRARAGGEREDDDKGAEPDGRDFGFHGGLFLRGLSASPVTWALSGLSFNNKYTHAGWDRLSSADAARVSADLALRQPSMAAQSPASAA